MFANLGLGGAAGLMVGLVAGACLLPVMAVQFVASRADRHD